MYLVADLGNTHIKLGLFDNGKLINLHRVEVESSESIIQGLDGVESAIVSSVLTNEHPVVELINKKFNTTIFDHNTPIPITNGYGSPQTLGNDRLANAVASHSIFPENNVLSVDFGTCIKFDLVQEGGNYLGGAISPGVLMRYRSLNQFTKQLPLVNKLEETALIGENTENSISSGVLNGAKAEVEGIISQYEEKFRNLKVIFTGGDHKYFAELQKNGIFARPNLTLEGLYKILIHNEIR